MTAARIFVVMETGLKDDTKLAFVRGDPLASNSLGAQFHACMIGTSRPARLLGVDVSDPNVDFTDIAACKAKAKAAIQAAAGTEFDVNATPVYRGHCWKNGGWTTCSEVHSFPIEESDGLGGWNPYYVEDGYLNGYALKTRFLAVVQKA